jgi:hypothetical protein
LIIVLRRIFGPKSKGKDYEENCIMMSLMAYILHLILSGKDEVGRTCSTHGEGEKCFQGFCWKAQREETTGKTKA